jgi:hypothetical protein
VMLSSTCAMFASSPLAGGHMDALSCDESKSPDLLCSSVPQSPT